MQVSDSETEQFSLTTDLVVLSEVLEVYSFPTEVPEVSEVQVLEEDVEAEDIATTTPNGTIMAQPLTLLMISTNTLSPNT